MNFHKDKISPIFNEIIIGVVVVDSTYLYCNQKNNRNFKCINQSKLDGRVQEIIQNKDVKKHLITCFFNDLSNKLPIFDDEDYLNFKVHNEIVINKTLNLGLFHDSNVCSNCCGLDWSVIAYLTVD